VTVQQSKQFHTFKPWSQLQYDSLSSLVIVKSMQPLPKTLHGGEQVGCRTPHSWINLPKHASLRFS